MCALFSVRSYKLSRVNRITYSKFNFIYKFCFLKKKVYLQFEFSRNVHFHETSELLYTRSSCLNKSMENKLGNCVYYINITEVPSELSRENLISSHVKISPLLWLHNKSCLSHQKTIKVKWFGISLVFI